jgi:hypothetical protein
LCRATRVARHFLASIDPDPRHHHNGVDGRDGAAQALAQCREVGGACACAQAPSSAGLALCADNGNDPPAASRPIMTACRLA